MADVRDRALGGGGGRRRNTTHRCTILRVNGPEPSIGAPFLLICSSDFSNPERLNCGGTGPMGSHPPSPPRLPPPPVLPPSVGPASLARFVRDALVKWAIIPVGESDDDFWQKADPAPCQTVGAAATARAQTRTRARIYAANKLFLITAGSMSARSRREAARGAKGGITSTNWGLKYKCSKTIIKFWWQITQRLCFYFLFVASDSDESRSSLCRIKRFGSDEPKNSPRHPGGR